MAHILRREYGSDDLAIVDSLLRNYADAQCLAADGSVRSVTVDIGLIDQDDHVLVRGEYAEGRRRMR